MTLAWPVRVLVPSTPDTPFLQPMPLSGTPAMSGGGGQIMQADPGYWTMSVGNIAVNRPPQIKAWRALAAKLSGPVTPILIPCFDRRGPWPLDSRGNEIRSLVDDGTDLHQAVILATCGAASAGATSVQITMQYGGEPEEGHFFSIGENLYLIASVDDEDDSGASPVYSMTIVPPLRDDVSANSAVNFDDPVCRMHLAPGSDMALTLQMARFGSPSLKFVEDL